MIFNVGVCFFRRMHRSQSPEETIEVAKLTFSAGYEKRKQRQA